MPPRPDFADRVHRLGVLVHLYPAGEVMQCAQLIGIHDEFLERRHKPPFQPATGVQHEVHPRQKPHVQTVGGLIGRLRIGQFRAVERPGAPVRQVQPSGQLPSAIGDMRSLRRAECGRTAVHVDRSHESPHDHRRTGTDELAIGDACQSLGQDLRQCPCDTHRGHRTPNNKRRNDAGLIVLGIDLESAHHHIVECHRRVDVDERGHHSVFLDEVLTKKDPAHIDTVLRPRRFGHRAHEGLVAERHMRMQHIEVTFVYRDVGRLAYRPPRMVQPFGHIAQLHEFLEVRHRSITAPPRGIAHKRRAIDRG